MQTRESRYISSSDGLKMQSEATATIAQASAQGVAKVQQGQQQYFEGLTQNNNNIGQLQQQLAQVELAGASRPSSLSQLGEGIVKGIAISQQEKAERAKLEKAEAEKLARIEADKKKTQTLSKFTQVIGDLTDSYEANNWANGEEQFKRDAAVLLQQLPKDVDPEVYQKLITDVYDTTRARSRKVGERLVQSTEQLRAGKVDLAKSQLRISLSSIVGSIASQSIDEQAKPYLDQANSVIRDFLDTDNGLPYGSKLSIVASAMDTVNEAWGKKHSRYLERTEGLQEWRTYAAEYKELEAKEAAGLITYDQFRNDTEALNFRYPGMEERTVQRGDKEKRDLAFQNLAEEQRKLSEQAGVRAITNYQVGKDTVKAIIAAAYTDPAVYNRLKNDPLFKDNPQFQEALKGADSLQAFYKQENQLIIAQANAAEQFARLDLSNLQTLTSLNRGVAKRQAGGQPLTATEQLAQQAINEMIALNPDLAASLELGAKGKPIPQINQDEINASLRQETAVIENIKQQIVQKIRAQEAALYKEFPDLLNYGLIGQGVNQDAIRAFAKNSSGFIEKEFQNIERLRLEAVQLQTQTSQYGIQPNFNQSSTYATSLDDRGRVKVVPRAKAQLIRLPDSSSVVTPIIAGTSAPVTSHWLDSRPGGRKHAGVDFGASNGARAIALVPGQVVHVGNDKSGYGGYVDVLGDNGVVYRYAHQVAQVKVGQRIGAGDVVSVSDGSGAGAPHLHFEVRTNPKFVNGKYQPSFGVDGTVEVLEHLKKLTAKDSNVTTPRFSGKPYRSAPNFKVPINSTLTNGGAINGQTYQRVGGKPGSVSSRISGQRPMSSGKAPFKVNLGQAQYDYGDDLGYAELAKDSRLRKAFVDTAKSLGVPTEWIVDIARQESGGINPYKDHNGNHYGLFGFGSDSLSDKSQWKRLRAGEIDAAGQLQMYAKYLKDNGWDKVKKQKKNAITIADLWAFTRMGWNMRQKFWETGNLNVGTNGGLTYADELKLLGKWAGRSYALPGSRSLRSSAVGEEAIATCSTCAQLSASNTFAAHTHDA